MTRSDVTHQGGGKPIPVDMKLGAALVRTMIAESARPGVPGLGDRFKGTN
ncbi:MAG TPA: hypothetical protein VMY35_12135 [Phycisphaerae bacterium]|nr:hypothetical protein [Phycisphaerae bacterium]